MSATGSAAHGRARRTLALAGKNAFQHYENMLLTAKLGKHRRTSCQQDTKLRISAITGIDASQFRRVLDDVFTAVGKDDQTFLLLVNSQDENGSTALHCAAYSHKPVLIKLLMSHGADPNIKDEDGNTPLHLAVGGCGVDKSAVKHCVTELLTVQVPGGRKSLLDTYNKAGLTPLMAAIRLDHADVAMLLLEQGADLTAKCREKSLTPIQLAVEEDRQSVLDALLHDHMVHTQEDELKGGQATTRLTAEDVAAAVAHMSTTWRVRANDYDRLLRNHYAAMLPQLLTDKDSSRDGSRGKGSSPAATPREEVAAAAAAAAEAAVPSAAAAGVNGSGSGVAVAAAGEFLVDAAARDQQQQQTSTTQQQKRVREQQHHKAAGPAASKATPADMGHSQQQQQQQLSAEDDEEDAPKHKRKCCSNPADQTNKPGQLAPRATDAIASAGTAAAAGGGAAEGAAAGEQDELGVQPQAFGAAVVTPGPSSSARVTPSISKVTPGVTPAARRALLLGVMLGSATPSAAAAAGDQAAAAALANPGAPALHAAAMAATAAKQQSAARGSTAKPSKYSQSGRLAAAMAGFAPDTAATAAAAGTAATAAGESHAGVSSLQQQEQQEEQQEQQQEEEQQQQLLLLTPVGKGTAADTRLAGQVVITRAGSAGADGVGEQSAPAGTHNDIEPAAAAGAAVAAPDAAAFSTGLLACTPSCDGGLLVNAHSSADAGAVQCKAAADAAGAAGIWIRGTPDAMEVDGDAAAAVDSQGVTPGPSSKARMTSIVTPGPSSSRATPRATPAGRRAILLGSMGLAAAGDQAVRDDPVAALLAAARPGAAAGLTAKQQSVRSGSSSSRPKNFSQSGRLAAAMAGLTPETAATAAGVTAAPTPAPAATTADVSSQQQQQQQQLMLMLTPVSKGAAADTGAAEASAVVDGVDAGEQLEVPGSPHSEVEPAVAEPAVAAEATAADLAACEGGLLGNTHSSTETDADQRAAGAAAAEDVEGADCTPVAMEVDERAAAARDRSEADAPGAAPAAVAGAGGTGAGRDRANSQQPECQPMGWLAALGAASRQVMQQAVQKQQQQQQQHKQHQAGAPEAAPHVAQQQQQQQQVQLQFKAAGLQQVAISLLLSKSEEEQQQPEARSPTKDKLLQLSKRLLDHLAQGLKASSNSSSSSDLNIGQAVAGTAAERAAAAVVAGGSSVFCEGSQGAEGSIPWRKIDSQLLLVCAVLRGSASSSSGKDAELLLCIAESAAAIAQLLLPPAALLFAAQQQQQVKRVTAWQTAVHIVSRVLCNEQVSGADAADGQRHRMLQLASMLAGSALTAAMRCDGAAAAVDSGVPEQQQYLPEHVLDILHEASKAAIAVLAGSSSSSSHSQTAAWLQLLGQTGQLLQVLPLTADAAAGGADSTAAATLGILEGVSSSVGLKFLKEAVQLVKQHKQQCDADQHGDSSSHLAGIGAGGGTAAVSEQQVELGLLQVTKLAVRLHQYRQQQQAGQASGHSSSSAVRAQPGVSGPEEVEELISAVYSVVLDVCGGSSGHKGLKVEVVEAVNGIMDAAVCAASEA